MNKNTEKYIQESPSPQKEIMMRLREIILSDMDNFSEDFKWGQPVYGINENICYFKCNKNHVNLGFFDAGKLSDPDNKMRHIKLKSLDDIDDKQLLKWLREAIS